MLSQLRRYDVQASYAAALAMMAVLPLVAAVVLAARRYNPELVQIVYGAEGQFAMAFLGCIALSSLPGGMAFVFGWSSAGQRRNDKPVRSWVGFFVGGTVLTLNFILLLTFWKLRFELPM